MLEIRPILSALLRHRSSTLLVVLQIAITFAVVVNSITIIQQRMALMERDSGLQEEQLMSFSVRGYTEGYDLEHNVRADIELLRNTPGVIDAVAVNQIPLSGSGDSGSLANSRENKDNNIDFSAGRLIGDEHLLNTLGVKLVAGRNFNQNEVLFDDDTISPRIVIITQSLADKLYPDGDALGKKIFTGTSDATIIGIVELMSGFWSHWSAFYDNIIYPGISPQRILVRTETNMRDQLLGGVEKLMQDRNPQRVVNQIRSMTEMRDDSYAEDTAMAKILWLVISLLVTITALGIVGIVSFNVNQRIKQIGTRRALGARRIDIQRYFITENILITSVGLVVGTMLAIGFNIYLVETFQMVPINWFYLPVGMLTMLVMGVISVWMPAQKASKVSPAVATQSI